MRGCGVGRGAGGGDAGAGGQRLFERYGVWAAGEEPSAEERVLAAARALASQWEFEIIERTDPSG